LIAHGRAPDEPVAIVSKATLPEQRVLETTLAEAVADLESSGIEPPSLVVVGRVVRLRDGLDWLGALEGKQLVSTPLTGRAPREAG
jgi:uroporphyrin-III C-methyltransferase